MDNLIFKFPNAGTFFILRRPKVFQNWENVDPIKRVERAKLGKLRESVEVGLARFERAGDGRGKLFMQTPN